MMREYQSVLEKQSKEKQDNNLIASANRKNEIENFRIANERVQQYDL